MSQFIFFVSFPLPYSFIVSHHTCVGVGYRYSTLDTSLRTTGASNVVTRLTSRSITGHALPIQVHQQYGHEFHLVLTDNSYISRGCYSAGAARRICTQLERSTLEGLFRVSLTRAASCLCLTRSNDVLGPTQYLACVGHSVIAPSVRPVRY